MKRALVAVGVFAGLFTGCSKIKTADVTGVIVKDVPLHEQQMLIEKYVGRIGWARMPIEDMTEKENPPEPKKKIIPRDAKIKIVDLNFVYTGSATIQDGKRKKIVAALNIERPLTVDKIEKRIDEMMWFQSPVLRHVDYIRQWGTKTARAVVNHEVFVGMPKEAALESWGLPSLVNLNEIGDNKTEEQWVYKQSLKSKYIYVLDGKVTKWED